MTQSRLEHDDDPPGERQPLLTSPAALLWMLAGVFLLILVVTVELVRVLVFGWIGFLWRVLPQVTVFWPSVIAAGIAVAFLLIGFHVAGRRWSRSQDEQVGSNTRWRFRWTLAIFVGLCVMFGAAISLVGVVHQVIWLATSDEPLRAPDFRHRPGAESRWQLRDIGQAINNHAAQHQSLPPGGSFDEQGRALHSWETHILPWLNYSSEINLERPWTHPENRASFRSVVPEFLNPEFRTSPFVDSEGLGLSHYAGNVYVLGPGTRIRPEELADGLASTPLVGEVNDEFVPWGHPVNWRDPALGINRSPAGFGGPAGNSGAHFLMADGSVRLISEDVDPHLLVGERGEDSRDVQRTSALR